MSGGKAELVKRVSDETNIELSWFSKTATNSPDGLDRYRVTRLFTIRGLPTGSGGIASGQLFLDGIPMSAKGGWNSLKTKYDYLYDTKAEGGYIDLVVPTGETFESVFGGSTITLTYQLAEPIITPIEVSGTLLSNPSGTIYVENVVADAGIYENGISILHQDLPISEVEKLSKVDFMTGVETDLDVSECEVAEDSLSFTHPNLTDGDIVFFTYYYDLESTLGETTLEYYDSRYVLKDDVTGKFYKVVQKVSDGELVNELVEV